MPVTCKTVREIREQVMERREAGEQVGFVPTLGALHKGHRALLREARNENDTVVASVFVNPTQFDTDEDAEVYPRDPDHDESVLAEEGVSLVFRPPFREMYPEGDCTEVLTRLPMTETYEGEYRPRFFEGVGRVVAKLLNAVPAHCVYFGEKDLQQLLLVRRMIRDLRFEHQVRTVPVERNKEGIAYSSRNRKFAEDDWKTAGKVHELMQEVKEKATALKRQDLQEDWWERFREAGIRLQYLDTVSWPSYEPVSPADSTAILILAGHVGPVRLKDNLPLHYESVRNLEEREL